MIQIEPFAVDADLPTVLYDNLFARGTLVASHQTAPDGLATNAVNGLTWDFWQPGVATASNFTVTLPAAETFNCLAIAAHTLGSCAATVQLLWTDVVGNPFYTLAEFTPPDDGPVMVLLPERTGAVVRLRIASAAAPPVIGVAMLGRKLTFPAELLAPYVPLADGQRIEADSAMSVQGQFLDPFISIMGAETTVQLSPVERAWADVNLPAFRQHYDRARPFFWAGAPSVLTDDVAYCRRNPSAGELRPALVMGGRYREIQMELEAYAG